MAPVNVFTRRYHDALQPDEIARRATVPPMVVSDAEALAPEVACGRLYTELNRMYVVTSICARSIAAECERALAHALATYPDHRSVLHYGYEFPSLDKLPEPYIPTFLTGPAGVGKSALRKAINRVLPGNTVHALDHSHAEVPLIDFASVTVRGQHSASGILRQLASPEVAEGRARISESALLLDCARWMRLSGTCLFAVDEMQSLTQSASASTLVTRVLLVLAEVRVPWIIVANYSLGHRLLKRPPEAVQRILARPMIVLPDAPGSADWLALIRAYDIVFQDSRAFEFVDHERELWNFTAGIKRLLRELTVHAYRLSRARGAKRMHWGDVSAAYLSKEYSSSREAVELLAGNAAQGTNLSSDLRCPFHGAEVGTQSAEYADSLRKVRASKVAGSVLDASLNAEERAVLASLASGNPMSTKAATNVVKIPRRRTTPSELLEAGRLHLESLSTAKDDPKK